MSKSFGALPLRFEANRGQAGDGADYLVRGNGYSAAVGASGLSLSVAGAAADSTIHMRLAGVDESASPRNGEQLPGASNYLRGRDPAGWVLGVPGFGSVSYPGAYPGIDVVYRGAKTGLKYDFVVAPGADPDRIQLAFDRPATVDAEGDLVIDTPAGPVRHERPVVYQEDGGRRRPVQARYVATAAGNSTTVRFELGRYDPSRTLVIDPAVVYSTFIGGPIGEGVNGVAVDGAGNAYVAGSTTSPDFPITPGSAQTTKGAGTSDDAFVAKFNPAGSALVYSTFLGGGSADTANAIAIDGAGNAYVAGTTSSTNFPLAGAFQGTKGSDSDAFVTKVNPAGNGLVYSTYLGKTGIDLGMSIAVDAGGSAYVTGSSASADFPTAAPFQGTKGAGTDAFVTKFDVAGSALVYSTFLGGGGADIGNGIALDGAANAYVVGTTASADPAPFPTAAAFQATKAAGSDAFVTKLNAAGGALVYSTHLGGAGADLGRGIAVDGSGAAYVIGTTPSTDFPVAAALQGTKGAGPEPDAFVTKLSAAGDSLAYSTYLGGPESETGQAVAVDSTGSAHVSGITSSELFPVERPVARMAGNSEAFVARLQPSGSSFIYSTHYGGLGSEEARAIAVDASQATYVGGLTSFARVPEYFPTINAFQPTFGGGFVAGTPNSGDGFLAKFGPDAPGRPLVTRVTPRGGDTGGGATVVVNGVGFNGASAVRFGDTAARSFTVESDTRLTAVAPTLAEGIHKITVSTPGGTSPGNPVADFWAGEGSWALTGSLNTARSAHTITLLNNGKVLVAGGRVSAGANQALASAELYDPLTGTWSTTGSMAQARWSHTATLLPDGRVLVAGGTSNNTTPSLGSAELFNPDTGTWSPAASLNGPRALHAATLLREPGCAAHCGKVLVAAGRPVANANTLNTAELFDPARNVWETTGNLNEARFLTEMVQVGDGRALIAGGFGPTDTAETFNPADGTWSFTGNPMRASKARPTVTRLPDGNALVNNGWASGPVPLSDVFDYRTNRFVPAGTPKTHRWNATAVLLPNGRVLALAGGVGGYTADVYDPKSNTFRSGGSLQFQRGASSVSPAGPGGTAVVLSSSTTEFQADPRVCGQHCGKVLIVGNTDEQASELYTPAAAPGGPGYWLVASDGGIFAFGDAQFYGSTGALRLNQPMVGMAATPGGTGYHLVAADGGIFAFGDAQFYGSTGAIRLNRPVVGMARTPSGRGYWLVASDGGIFAFGDAPFYGSTGNLRLNQPVVGMAATPSGKGYWMVAADGGIFAFGDAQFYGSTGALRLNQPVVGMAATITGKGYRLVAADGGIFAFGDASFHGSTGAIRLNQPMVGMAATLPPSTSGYWLVAADGGVFAFGEARFAGSTGAIRLNRPMVGMAAAPPAG
ncbi:MAG: SBBP repeat-containing protein [Acidimicrobiales bacterium]